MSIGDWSETSRRLFGLAGLSLFVAGGFFVGAGNIGEVPPEERFALWRLFTMVAIPAAALMGWYSWRKLTYPEFDTKLKVEGWKIVFPIVVLTFGITRFLPEDGAVPVAGGGLTAGFFGGVLLVYGFDAVTGRLSKGRSWRHDLSEARDDAHSNTSSPS